LVLIPGAAGIGAALGADEPLQAATSVPAVARAGHLHGQTALRVPLEASRVSRLRELDGPRTRPSLIEVPSAGGIGMLWEKPSFYEIELNAEINSYYSDQELYLET
jgi:coenzyme PQQ precursor peptide PqqA